MHRLSLILVFLISASGCSSRGDSGQNPATSGAPDPEETMPELPDSAMEKAVKAPLVDLNLLRKKIPDVLREARREPYQMPEISTCDALRIEINRLDSALGPDLDRRGVNDGETLTEKGREEAGDATADALKDLTTGWIPYRGWVRRLTGAERWSREVSKHIAAGITRRAFLKGFGQAEGCVTPAAPAAALRLYDTWRLVLTRPAPWMDPDTPLDRRLLGQSLVLDEENLTGPAPLICADAEVEVLRMPPDGLFEGGLPAPADLSAQNQGFTDFPVETLRISCANASFDLHRVDGDTLLFALDNQIYVLSSTTGSHQAVAHPAAPESIVQHLLEAHFSGDMGFEKASLANKLPWLSADLARRADAWFATTLLEDEPPLINGDPFTDSQDHPARFAVDAAAVTGTRAIVPVRFADAWRQYTVTYHLVITETGWRVDDLIDRQGHSLREQLASPAPSG